MSSGLFNFAAAAQVEVDSGATDDDWAAGELLADGGPQADGIAGPLLAGRPALAGGLLEEPDEELRSGGEFRAFPEIMDSVR
jgi:hypothetical protein